MTDAGAIEFIDRLIGTYPLQYKGFNDEEIKKITKEVIRNYQGYEDEDIYNALSVYINQPDSKMPPSPGQIKALVNNRAEKREEQDWDRTRLVYDEEGRLFYNQLFEDVESKNKPGHIVTVPVPGTRPLDGKKGYTPASVPKSNDDLVELCRKRGWSVEVEEVEGRKSYTFDHRLDEYLHFRGMKYDIDQLARRAFRKV